MWTQAIAIAEGDPGKTQAAYIRLRLADLKKSAFASSIPPVEIKTPIDESKSLDGRLLRLRSDLTRKLRVQGKLSLYSSLGLHPDASDAMVAAAIAELESKSQGNTTPASAEFRYAKETLGNPVTREVYDRKFFVSISNDGTGQFPVYADEQTGYGNSWWASGKVTAIIGVLSVAIFGYLALGFIKEHGGHEVQKDAINSQREVAHAIVDNDQQKSQAEIFLQSQDMENKNSIALQMQEQQREQQDRQYDLQNVRENFQQQQMENQQKQAESIREQRQVQLENMKTQRDKQYWACINQQLSLRNSSSSDAYARCAMYR